MCRCNTEHVENFIRAYYLEDTAIEGWLKENCKLYTQKQLANVVTVSSAKLAKKERTRLIKYIDELLK